MLTAYFILVLPILIFGAYFCHVGIKYRTGLALRETQFLNRNAL